MKTVKLTYKKHLYFLLISFLFYFAFSFGSIANTQSFQPDSTSNTLLFQEWLTAGPIEINMPVFHNQNNLDGKIFKVEDLLKSEIKSVIQPFEGAVFLKKDNQPIIWKKQKSSKSGDLTIQNPRQAQSALFWQASYLLNDSYCSITIEVETDQCFSLYVDGELVLSKMNFTKKGKETEKKEKKLKLEPGKHLISLVSLFNSLEQTKWQVKAKVLSEKDDNIRLSLNNEKFMDMKLLLEGQRLKNASLSVDGKYIMFKYTETYPPNGKSDTWFEVHDRYSGRVVFNSKGRKMGQTQWTPLGHKISYSSKLAEENTLEILDLDNFETNILIQSKAVFNNHTWAKNGTFLIYSDTEKPKEKKNSLYKLEGMSDRWPWWRKRSQLYILYPDDHSSQQITYGYLSNNLHDIRPDGKKILISHDFPDYSERPYSKQVLMEISLDDMHIDTIWEKRHGGSASYSPDGKKLLVTGSPILFGAVGVNLKENEIPNDYDSQAYIYDLNSRGVSAFTRDFNPSISSASWNSNDQLIYFIGQDGTYRKAFVFDPIDNTITDLGAKTDIVKSIDFALDAHVLVYTGNSISYPEVGFTYNLQNKEQKLVADPEASEYKNVIFGKTEDWHFKNKDDVTIEGRVYYPPDFNPNEKYPLIVYYYGGTSPVDRSFRGRYPKNLYAAMGYVVYVLQPSGATGYGQEFSSMHVNNWGTTVANEIISGTKLFLEDHQFVDPEKVGCIGASYGGFMTMLLSTRTDIFAAAISHAGISSISSYWGEGFWGYAYSSVASANSFPWNNKEMYVEQSPLFNADKVNTPLLLLHGDKDTNVPHGESIQMYTALKLLGKEVELVEVEGQDHHITDYKKRILWQKTIFAWFDKWLKNDSDWWGALYPEKNL